MHLKFKSKAYRSTLKILNDFSETHLLMMVSLFVIVSRWLGHMRYLYLSDSVRYALALDKYDITVHQPHPPGYAFYVLLAKPFYWITGDANVALIVVSIIFSVLSVWAVFYLAKKIYGRRVAWISLLLLVTGSLFWFHGQVALNYMTDVFFSAWFGIYVYDVLKNRKEKSLTIASVVLAVGGGFRPTFMIFMLPLWSWLIIRQKSFKCFLKNALIILAITLSWVIPAALLSGGFIKFWQAVYALIFDKSALYSFSAAKIGITQVWIQFKMIFHNLIIHFGLACVAVVLWIVSMTIPSTYSPKINLQNLFFWLLLILPPTIFYLTVIFTLPGYLLIMLPALSILVAKTVEIVTDQVKGLLNKAGIVLLPVVTTVIASVNVFIYYHPFHSDLEFQRPSFHTIHSMNRIWDGLIVTIPKEFNPQNTIIGVNNPFLTWGLPHFQYYLPKYVTYSKILWGISHADDEYWYKAYAQKYTLVDKIEVYDSDTKLIVVEKNWTLKGPNLVSIDLPDRLGKIFYYDLTDPQVKSLVKKIKKLEFVGEVDE